MTGHYVIHRAFQPGGVGCHGGWCCAYQSWHSWLPLTHHNTSLLLSRPPFPPSLSYPAQTQLFQWVVLALGLGADGWARTQSAVWVICWVNYRQQDTSTKLVNYDLRYTNNIHRSKSVLCNNVIIVLQLQDILIRDLSIPKVIIMSTMYV